MSDYGAEASCTMPGRYWRFVHYGLEHAQNRPNPIVCIGMGLHSPDGEITPMRRFMARQQSRHRRGPTTGACSNQKCLEVIGSSPVGRVERSVTD